MNNNTLIQYLIEPETFKNQIIKEIENFNNFYNKLSIKMTKYI